MAELFSALAEACVSGNAIRLLKLTAVAVAKVNSLLMI